MSEVKESGEVSTSATWRFFGSLFFGWEGEGEAGSSVGGESQEGAGAGEGVAGPVPKREEIGGEG